MLWILLLIGAAIFLIMMWVMLVGSIQTPLTSTHSAFQEGGTAASGPGAVEIVAGLLALLAILYVANYAKTNWLSDDIGGR